MVDNMKTMQLGRSGLQVPVLAVGGMHLNRLDKRQAEAFVETCQELGCNFFDHADVYGMDRPGEYGRCEEIFAEATHMTPRVRDRWILQTKVGFTRPLPGERKPEMICTSKESILQSVHDSLRRLNTEYLDVLLLHAPDALLEPEEVAEAFEMLHRDGKVRHFGVSNYSAGTLQLLQKTVRQPLDVNQLMVSLVNSGILSRGMYVNREESCAVDRDGGVLDYCRFHEMTIQCWGTMQFGYMSGCFLNHPDYPQLNAVLEKTARDHGTTKAAVAIAWLLRHPAHLMPITGTVSVEHLRQNAAGADVNLSRSEWYALWKAAGNFIR